MKQASLAEGQVRRSGLILRDAPPAKAAHRSGAPQNEFPRKGALQNEIDRTLSARRGLRRSGIVPDNANCYIGRVRRNQLVVPRGSAVGPADRVVGPQAPHIPFLLQLQSVALRTLATAVAFVQRVVQS